MSMPLTVYISGNWLVVIIYVFATIANVHGILFENNRSERLSYRLAGSGLALHGALLGLWWLEVGHGPYMAPGEVLSSDAWAVLACFFIFARIYPHIRPASIIAFPASFLMLALAIFYNPGIRSLPATFRSVWLIIHIGLYKIALATLILAFTLAVFYLIKKRWTSNWLQRVPPLETLDAYGYRFAGFGFIFWTIGMLAGSIWAYQSWGRFWGWDPTETWSLITCLMFGIYLHLRRFFKLEGRVAAWIFIGCFTIALVTVFGMATLRGSIHAEYFK